MGKAVKKISLQDAFKDENLGIKEQRTENENPRTENREQKTDAENHQVYFYTTLETAYDLKRIVKQINDTRPKVKGRERITTASILRGLLELVPHLDIPDGKITSPEDIKKHVRERFL